MAAGTVTEQVVEQVADHLEEAAQVTRRIDTRSVGFFLGGTTFGLAMGLIFGYRYNREKIKAEAFSESAEEIKRIRENYEQRVTARQEKPPVEELIEEKGYAVVEERLLRPPVPVVEPPQPKSVREHFAGNPETLFPKRTADAEKSKDDGWNYAFEQAKRTPDRPYIIHQDEFHKNESGYQQVTYTVYEGDGVITDEDDMVIENADNLIGLHNLNRWGHGSDDFNVLHIRNSALELEFELCRTPNSYASEVQGFDENETN